MLIFNVMCKKNQTSVSSADEKSKLRVNRFLRPRNPKFGSTDDAGNSQNLVSGIIRFTLGLRFLGLQQRLMTNYLDKR